MVSRIGIGRLLLLGLFVLAAMCVVATIFFKSDAVTSLVREVAMEDDDFEHEAESRDAGILFRRLSLQDENGKIDPEGLRKSRLQVEEMKKVRAARAEAKRGRIQEAGLYPDSWFWLGPSNIGGRVRSISIRPDNPNDILVGSVSGGIWRTFDGGVNWFPVDDFMANLAVTAIARNPANLNQIYVGTGEGFGNVDAIQGAGVFVSNDGGANFSQVPSTNSSNFNFVNRIAISPNGSTILVATSSGLFRSTNVAGIWQQPIFGPVADVDFLSPDGTLAIAGYFGGARFSVNGGQSFGESAFSPAVTNGGQGSNDGRTEVACRGLVCYASVNNNDGNVYRSTNGGQSFTRVNTGTNYFKASGPNQGWYDNAIWVNPVDTNTILVGGIDVYRSTDGGTTLVKISDGSDSAHADQHFIVEHPGFNNTTNRIVYYANDGGVFRTDDFLTANANAGWTSLSNRLGITQFYGAAGNVFGTIIGGTQDNGTLRFRGNGNNWTLTATGDGGFVAADQTDRNYFYGETQNLGVFRSSDEGATSTPINAGIADAIANCSSPPGTPVCQANFIAPLTLDPSEPTRLLAGGWSLWRTSNARAAAPTWTSIKAPTFGNAPISAITVSANNSSFIVVGHNNGDIYRTFDGTNEFPSPVNWTKIDTAQLPSRFVTRIVIDTTRAPNWIYATFGGFSGDNVWVTKDLGASWSDVTGVNASTGLPNVPVRALAIHPYKPDLLYAGTEIGIFTSEDAGTTWDLPNGGPSNVSVDELFWLFGDLIAVTHGRGLYRASGGVYVDCNYPGEQFGTFDMPFRTVNAAINSITTVNYKPIWLKPCVYNETVISTPNKRFELRSLGGATIVGQ